MSEATRAPADVFEKARSHDRKEQLEAAKEADLLPYFRLLTSEAGPLVEMEGRETIMLGSNNYLGLTGDPRVKAAAREALDRYGTALTGSRLLNGTIPLHVELEREIAEWMGTEDAIVFTTGYQANLGTIGTILEPGDTVICDSGDHASILDGCRLSGAKLRPFRHNQMDKLEKMLERAERRRGWRARGRGRGLLDGGRHLPAAGDRRAHGAPRRPADGRRGARRGRLGRAGRRRLRAVRARGSRRPANGHLLEEPRLLRRLRRRPGRRDRVPADLRAGLRVHRGGGPRFTRGGAGSDPDLPARGAPAVRSAARQRRLPAPGASASWASWWSSPAASRTGRAAITPVVPVVVGEDWQAVLLWKALFEAGVYTNVALYPAVPPGGALLRTSLMATHERDHIDRALEIFAEGDRRLPRAAPLGLDSSESPKAARLPPP